MRSELIPVLFGQNDKLSFDLPLLTSLVPRFAAGSPTPTFTRNTTATVMGYAEADTSAASQSLLTIPAGIPRFEGARFIASDNTWSGFFADGVAIPEATLKGYLGEGERTNLLLNSAVPVTQNITTTAQAYTISMWGTGTCELSGTATGTLTGTGANDRVQLTVTPTAGTLTLTFAGTNTNGQLEAGAFASSYIPTGAASVTRNADNLKYSSIGNIADLNISAYFDFTPVGFQVYYQLLQVDDGTNNNRISFAQTNGKFRLDLYSDGVAAYIGVPMNPNQFIIKELNKVSISLLNTKSKLTYSRVNGVSITFPSITEAVALVAPYQLSIGIRLNDTTTSCYGNIKNIKIWKNALKDSKLIRLTQ